MKMQCCLSLLLKLGGKLQDDACEAAQEVGQIKTQNAPGRLKVGVVVEDIK